VRVTPAGSSDVDRHNGYSAILRTIGIEVREPVDHAQSSAGKGWAVNLHEVTPGWRSDVGVPPKSLFVDGSRVFSS